MSQLIWRAYSERMTDKVEATFDGTPIETLGSALEHFKQQAIDTTKRLASGAIPEAPEVIIDNANRRMDQIEDGSYYFPFTVNGNLDGTFSIWLSDGPDRYDLVP